jgi:cell division protein FtsL
MSEDKEKSDLIAVTKNQALGVGGAGVAITTIVALTSTFLTKGDKDALQAQISQNKAAIEYMKTEIKDGFRDQREAS